MTKLLSRKAYKALESAADEVTDGLNRAGLANWTVCPECHVDDFVHVAGCSLSEKGDHDGHT